MSSANGWRIIPPDSMPRLVAPDNMDHSAAHLEALDTIEDQLFLAMAPFLTRIQRARNNSTFLCRIPPEIICRIISFAKVDYGWPKLDVARLGTLGNGDEAMEASGAEHTPRLGWLVLTHICSRWREVALGTPLLWTDPSDYFAIPPALCRLILARAQEVPCHLELSASSLRLLTISGRKIFPPGRGIPIAVLRLLGFSVGVFNYLAHDYFLPGSFQHLHHLTVGISLKGDELPVLLPAALSSCTSITQLRLSNCFPPRWDAPMFGPRLTHLTLTYGGVPEVPHLMPSTLEFSRILTSATALQVLAIDGIHLQGSPIQYPAMILPSDLGSIDVYSWRDSVQHRDFLIFLANIVLKRQDIRMNFSLGPPDGDIAGSNTALDPRAAKETLSLIRVALDNLYRQQQSPPKHLVLCRKALLTHDSETERSAKRAWPTRVMQYLYTDIPGVTSLLNFNFGLESIDDASFVDSGLDPVPLRDLRSVSLNSSGADSYLSSGSWWRAMRKATYVHRLGIYFRNCQMLLPLTETVVVNEATVFTTFPRLKVLHIHLEGLSIAKGGADLDEGDTECAQNLAVIHTLVHARRKHSAQSQLESLVVDSVLSRWKIWETIAVDVPIRFCDFHALPRSPSDMPPS
ncbi:unnamed protein product [Peniophora sp. CBMAI 1063]|nr:unnamed protein product [Peniophora sp. CBMAI 1063]